MFLRAHTRKKNGAVYEYWTLEESVRTLNGPRQRTVATLGKLPGLNEETRIGWEHIRDVLDGRLLQRELLRAEADPPVCGPWWTRPVRAWNGCGVLARCISAWRFGVD